MVHLDLAHCTPMDALDLESIEARHQAATPGVWEVVASPSNQVLLASIWAPAEVVDAADLSGQADAAFIAHAHEDVPLLIAEIRRLRALSGS